MAPLRAGRPLKRWRYVGVYRPDVMLCVGDARVAGIRSAGGPSRCRTARCSRAGGASRWKPGASHVRGVLDLELTAPAGVEVVSPHGRSYMWTRKHRAGARARHRDARAAQTFELDGDDGFVDESAGYHARHTAWRWSAGIGRAVDGRAVAWNLVDGVHDTLENSERTVWIDGVPREEVPPQEFADDLSAGRRASSSASGRPARSNRNLLVMRNRYRQPFGEFSGTLPGGLALAEGYGVMEEHDVLW